MTAPAVVVIAGWLTLTFTTLVVVAALTWSLGQWSRQMAREYVWGRFLLRFPYWQDRLIRRHWSKKMTPKVARVLLARHEGSMPPRLQQWLLDWQENHQSKA